MTIKHAIVAACLALTIILPSVGTTTPLDLSTLGQRVVSACPAIWEDIKAAIEPESVSGDPWQADATDRDAFIDFIEAELGLNAPGPAELEAMADDIATVAAECATQRLGLLDGLVDKLPNDALAAIDAVTEQLSQSIGGLDNDGFLVGDVRFTGRPEPAEGWLFLVGQSLGNVDSGADLAGEDYQALFDLARTWAPNTGSEDFASNDVVVLPDMRGRVLAGLDNMGGTAANRLTAAAASQPGGSIGAQSHALSVDEMPSHAHGMGGAGNHAHSYEDVRPVGGSTIDSGSGKGTASDTKWTSTTGYHVHSIYSTGGGQAHPIVQPTLALNVEMKYR